MQRKIVNMKLPVELVQLIEEAAKANFATRSDYMRQAIVDRLRAENRLDPQQTKKLRTPQPEEYLW